MVSAIARYSVTIRVRIMNMNNIQYHVDIFYKMVRKNKHVPIGNINNAAKIKRVLRVDTANNHNKYFKDKPL